MFSIAVHVLSSDLYVVGMHVVEHVISGLKGSFTANSTVLTCEWVHVT